MGRTWLKAQRVMVACGLWGVLCAVGVASAGPAAWHDLSQLYRNTAIYLAAYGDLNKYVGLNCKEWTRQVVLRASGGQVTIPLTAPNADGWSWFPSKDVRALGQVSVEKLRMGQIIQMHWRSWKKDHWETTPHTAIVVYASAVGVTFIESNFGAGNALTVRTRFVSKTNFDGHIGLLYSVFEIL